MPGSNTSNFQLRALLFSVESQILLRRPPYVQDKHFNTINIVSTYKSAFFRNFNPHHKTFYIKQISALHVPLLLILNSRIHLLYIRLHNLAVHRQSMIRQLQPISIQKKQFIIKLYSRKLRCYIGCIKQMLSRTCRQMNKFIFFVRAKETL